MEDEIEFYYHLLEESSTISRNNYQKFVWKCRKIIELMDILNESYDKKIIRNMLIFILSLFDNYKTDFLSSRGVELKELSETERKILISTLKDEFLS
ncbi:MAG: hypothetical protein ACFFDO_05410 [Candidatus Thorarchaeota archaeon]